MDKGELPLEVLLLMERLSLVQLDRDLCWRWIPAHPGGDGEPCSPPQQQEEANMTCQVQGLYSEGFRMGLGASCSGGRCPCPWQGVALDGLLGAFQPNLSCDSF